jgi:hypothetical protein
MCLLACVNAVLMDFVRHRIVSHAGGAAECRGPAMAAVGEGPDSDGIRTDKLITALCAPSCSNVIVTGFLRCWR